MAVPHRVDVDPSSTFIIAAGARQPIAATVVDGTGRVVDADVIWRVTPPDAARVDITPAGAQLIAGRRSGLAWLVAIAGSTMSQPVEVQIWPSQGLRFGFRAIGGAYPLVPPPGPRRLKARTRR